METLKKEITLSELRGLQYAFSFTRLQEYKAKVGRSWTAISEMMDEQGLEAFSRHVDDVVDPQYHNSKCPSINDFKIKFNAV